MLAAASWTYTAYGLQSLKCEQSQVLSLQDEWNDQSLQSLCASCGTAESKATVQERAAIWNLHTW